MSRCKNTITAEQARERLLYNPYTGEFTWLLHRNSNMIDRIAGCVDTRGYTRITLTIDGRKQAFGAHRLAWLITHGRWPKDQLDHINGIRTDNRILNLRECTQAENNANTKLYKNNQSGVKGVCWEPDRKRWAAYIREDKKLRRIGRFKTKEEAISARKQAFEDYYHEFCRYE